MTYFPRVCSFLADGLLVARSLLLLLLLLLLRRWEEDFFARKTTHVITLEVEITHNHITNDKSSEAIHKYPTS